MKFMRARAIYGAFMPGLGKEWAKGGEKGFQLPHASAGVAPSAWAARASAAASCSRACSSAFLSSRARCCSLRSRCARARVGPLSFRDSVLYGLANESCYSRSTCSRDAMRHARFCRECSAPGRPLVALHIAPHMHDALV